MRFFTYKDLTGNDNDHIYTDYDGGKSEDLVYEPLQRQEKGLQQTASGYYAKLATQWKIHFNGKLYRIYSTCFSNVASHWFTAKGKKIFVS